MGMYLSGDEIRHIAQSQEQVFFGDIIEPTYRAISRAASDHTAKAIVEMLKKEVSLPYHYIAAEHLEAWLEAQK